MDSETISHKGKILILATETCAYPGADSVGQSHSSYPTNTFILRVRAPVLFPERFYMDCFKKGISGIIIWAYIPLVFKIDPVEIIIGCSLA